MVIFTHSVHVTHNALLRYRLLHPMSISDVHARFKSNGALSVSLFSYFFTLFRFKVEK